MSLDWVRENRGCVARGDATNPGRLEKYYAMHSAGKTAANVKYDDVAPGCGSTCVQTMLVSYAKDMNHFPQGEGIEQ
jgi:hypothetical protein